MNSSALLPRQLRHRRGTSRSSFGVSSSKRRCQHQHVLCHLFVKLRPLQFECQLLQLHRLLQLDVLQLHHLLQNQQSCTPCTSSTIACTACSPSSIACTACSPSAIACSPSTIASSPVPAEIPAPPVPAEGEGVPADDDNALVCAICQDVIRAGDRVRKLNCPHSFHDERMEGWFRVTRDYTLRCPMRCAQ